MGVVLALTAAACGGGGGDTAATPSGPVETPSPSASAWAPLPGPLGECGPQPPPVQASTYEPLTLADPEVGSVPAARLGEGRTALVLLPQTDGNGLCGWLPFMPVAAAAGYATLAVDLCQYGAQCLAVDAGTFTDADQTDPVEVAVRYAREELGARRVVVMGASMGGSVALMSAVAVPGLTAVVDLSGPLDWPGVEVARGGRAVPVPALVAMASTEGDDAVAGARAVAERAPEGSAFLAAETGHGWDLVTDPEGEPTPLAAEVLAWLDARG